MSRNAGVALGCAREREATRGVRGGVEEVVVNKDAVEKNALPLFVYSEEASSDAEPASA